MPGLLGLLDDRAGADQKPSATERTPGTRSVITRARRESSVVKAVIGPARGAGPIA